MQHSYQYLSQNLNILEMVTLQAVYKNHNACGDLATEVHMSGIHLWQTLKREYELRLILLGGDARAAQDADHNLVNQLLVKFTALSDAEKLMIIRMGMRESFIEDFA